jgi:glycosyltransferase involved in cell wall biosynthesis
MNSEPCCDLRVLSQWPDPFLLPDGSLAFPDQALLASGRYQLINTALDRHEYAALLYRSDLIVLPYRRSSYHNRVSRVAIEAAIQGIPLVYMSGTWCEELVELTGAGVAIPEESAEAVCQALRTAFDHLPNLRLQARRTARLVAEKFSGRRFRQRLLEC